MPPNTALLQQVDELVQFQCANGTFNEMASLMYNNFDIVLDHFLEFSALYHPARDL